MNYDNQELQTLLIEAQLINQKVKAIAENKISAEQVEKFANQRAQDKRRRQQAKLRKQNQILQKKIKGRDGKGITKDFSHFCRFCHKEYELDTPKCLKCNRPTMTLEQRQKQLQFMVEDYKYNKKSREEKRQKWEMFQKTEASMWKKSSINYNKKWEYFVQDSEQEPQKQPILPTNDPNFKALEADIEERKRRRAQDTQKAKRLKQKGNAAMKQGDYQKAMEMYTLALEHIKDLKSVYTNRALAYIKLKKYRKAIKDCTNVIEYMQIFEKIGQNKDLTFKAFSRRAVAKKQLKQYKQALVDINEALKLLPKDNSALLLKKQLQGFIQHSQTVQRLIRENKEKEKDQKIQQKQQEKPKENENSQEKVQQDSEEEEQKSKKLQKQIIKELAEKQLSNQKQQQIKKQQQEKKVEAKIQNKILKETNPLTAIPERLSNLNESNVQYLLNLLVRQKQMKSLFISSKGIELTLDYLVKAQSPKNQAMLICLCFEGNGVAQKRVWDWGVFKIYEIIQSKFQNQTKLNLSVYGFVDNLIQILVSLSLSQVYRPILSSNQKTFQFIEFLFPKLITKYKKQPRLLDDFMTFFSNLCSGDSVLKNTYLNRQKFNLILQSLYLMVFDHKTKNRQILDLKQSLYSFIANALTNQDNRRVFFDFIGKNNRLNDLKQELQFYPRLAHNFQPYIENVLSVIANATMDTQVEAGEISSTIFQRFITHWQEFNPTIVHRALLSIGRFKYSSNINLNSWMKTFDKMVVKIDPLKNAEDKLIPQMVKILNVLFMVKGPETIQQIPTNLLKTLQNFVKNNSVNEQLFCNSCNLFGIIIDLKSPLTLKVIAILRGCIARLVEIAKQNVGNWRKSAAILLGKSSFDSKCKQQLDRNHGMQVLKSIAQFVIDKK